MKLEEMRKIAEQRTKGDWSADGFDPNKNLKFLYLANHTYDALLEIAEAASKINKCDCGYGECQSCIYNNNNLDDALKALEESP